MCVCVCVCVPACVLSFIANVSVSLDDDQSYLYMLNTHFTTHSCTYSFICSIVHSKAKPVVRGKTTVPTSSSPHVGGEKSSEKK